MYCLSVPVEISFQRSWSSIDSIFRSSRDISGLIAIPGKSLSFARLERIEDTSQDRENFARIGRCLVSVYFPSLWQSHSEWSGTCGSTDFMISVMALVSCMLRRCLLEPFFHTINYDVELPILGD